MLVSMIKLLTNTSVCFILLSSATSQNAVLKQFSDQFANIAEKVNPAVVTILTEKKIPEFCGFS